MKNKFFKLGSLVLLISLVFILPACSSSSSSSTSDGAVNIKGEVKGLTQGDSVKVLISVDGT